MRWGSLLITLVIILGARSVRADPPLVHRSISDGHVILFVLDGCRTDLFDRLLAEGQLPNLQRFVVDAGARFTDAVTIFPSVTTAGYVSMMTGQFPGHMGVPYLEWFEREPPRAYRFLSLGGRRDLNHSVSVPSLYEALWGHPTAAVYSQFNRRATLSRPRQPLGMAWRIFVLHQTYQLNRPGGAAVLSLFRKPIAEIPRFTMVGMLGSDFAGHMSGAQHPHVVRAIRDFDRFLGTFVALLQRRGLWDTTYLIVTSDHGMHDIRGIIPLDQWMTSIGLHPIHPRRPTRGDVYIASRGVSVATLTFPDRQRIPAALAFLRQRPEIELILARQGPRPGPAGAERRTRVLRGTREGWVSSQLRGRDRVYRYTAGTGDPLQLRRIPALRPYLQGRPLTASAWNRLLHDTDTPAVVPQLAQLFDDGRAGDLVVIPTADWAFFHTKAATHGRHDATDMRVPLVIRGPGIPSEVRHHAQVSDLYPTILRWFGLPLTLEAIDGRPLFE